MLALSVNGHRGQVIGAQMHERDVGCIAGEPTGQILNHLVDTPAPVSFVVEIVWPHRQFYAKIGR